MLFAKAFYGWLFVLAAPLFAASDAHALYLDAYNFYSQKNFQSAEQAIHKSLELDDKIADSYLLLARIYLRQSRNRESITAYKRGMSLKLRAKQELLAISAVQKSFEPTSTSESEALNQMSGAKQAYYQARIALRQGHWYEAIDLFWNAIDQEPRVTIYQNALAKAYLDVKDPISSELIYRDSLKIDPYQVPVYRQLAQSFGEANYAAKAIFWAEEGLKYFPADTILRDKKQMYELRLRREQQINESR